MSNFLRSVDIKWCLKWTKEQNKTIVLLLINCYNVFPHFKIRHIYLKKKFFFQLNLLEDPNLSVVINSLVDLYKSQVGKFIFFLKKEK